MTLEDAKRAAKKELSPKRYRHTKNVARAAEQLATRYGADVEKARLAAWLHDVTKEKGRGEQLQLLEQDAIMAGCTKDRPQPVWHGPTGAIYARTVLGVQDEEVLSAIACHTTGKPDMGLLDKVLFMADIISEERGHEGVERLRRLAETDLDTAVMAAMEENIAYLKRAGKTLDEDTLQALEYLKAQHANTIHLEA